MVGDFPSFEYLVRYTHARRATVQSNELYRQAALLGPGCYTLYTEPRNLRVRTNTFKARTSMRRDDQQGEQFMMIGYVNSAVHAVMYSYYFLAALGPQFRKFLWFKPYITWMQMVRILKYKYTSLISQYKQYIISK
ncbi:hypothetical protein J6590_072087 [Homalodisca vitripennis]|nr:hypothetical protein J6590_072087 [Homalodisca vitripennis]